jgi:hypothetical protein
MVDWRRDKVQQLLVRGYSQWDVAKELDRWGQEHNDNSNLVTTGDDRTRLQALSLINNCYKYIMDLTINGVVITDAIKFVQTTRRN